MTFRALACASLFGASLLAQTPAAYLVDTDQDLLYALDLATGAVTVIGSTLNNGLATCADLCWRDDTNELWTVDLSGGEAGTIDPATGTFTPIWQTALSGWQGMAWDHTEKQFYLHNQNDNLYRLDPVSGALTLVGVLSPTTPLVTAIEIDALGRLWGIAFSPGQILPIDKTTGVQGTPIPLGVNNVQGLAITADGVWYGVNTTTDSLYIIDERTGGATLVGPNTGTQFAKGMAIVGAAVQRGGYGCPDGSGVVRRMTFSGNSNLGGLVLHGIEAGATPTVGFLGYGFSTTQAGPLALPLDMAAFGAPGCRLYHSWDAIGGAAATGSTAAFAIPVDPTLVSLNVFVQGAMIDSGTTPNAAGLVFSDALKLTIVP